MQIRILRCGFVISFPVTALAINRFQKDRLIAMAQAGPLADNAGEKRRCQHIGCNDFFTEADNPEGACTYHPGVCYMPCVLASSNGINDVKLGTLALVLPCNW
jgi:hypothetical protein